MEQFDLIRRRAKGIASVLVFTLIAAAAGAGEPRTETVGPDEFFALYGEKGAGEGAVLIDVRTPEEYGSGHAAPAVNIDYYGDGFRDALDALDRDGTYFLYCRSGSRSSRVLGMMESMGFEEVYDLAGGWSRNEDRLRELDD